MISGFTPLHLSVRGQHITVVVYLAAKYPESLEFPDEDGMTAVMWSAARCFSVSGSWCNLIKNGYYKYTNTKFKEVLNKT